MDDNEGSTPYDWLETSIYLRWMKLPMVHRTVTARLLGLRIIASGVSLAMGGYIQWLWMVYLMEKPMKIWMNPTYGGVLN